MPLFLKETIQIRKNRKNPNKWRRHEKKNYIIGYVTKEVQRKLEMSHDTRMGRKITNPWNVLFQEIFFCF